MNPFTDPQPANAANAANTTNHTATSAPTPPIPSYEEVTGYAPPPGPPPSHPSHSSYQTPSTPTTTIPPPLPTNPTPPPELPPAYAVVDEKATSYAIYGTFIHTPSGPAYQLSSLLDARINKLRIRRLRAEEVSLLQAGAHNIPFNQSTTLYEMHDPPFMTNEYYIRGISRTTLPGMLQLRLGLRRWHVRHMPAEGAKPVDLMTCGKRGGLSRVIKERRNEFEPSEWKDSEGSVLATEVLKMQGGGKMPTIELREGVDQTCRELLLALWVARLWAAFGAGSSYSGTGGY
ncbi:hypothetical protein NX059_011426 [Plenodomus lindquistii]|nr:hypothetical protein NX059_011426 [Plenodomus lindquistii]